MVDGPSDGVQGSIGLERCLSVKDFSFCTKLSAVVAWSPEGRKLPQKFRDFDSSGFTAKPSRSVCVHVHVYACVHACVCVCLCVCGVILKFSELSWKGPRPSAHCLFQRFCRFAPHLPNTYHPSHWLHPN